MGCAGRRRGGSVSAADVLRSARARIATPETWTKGTAARNLTGHDVAANSKEAVCWCAMGALWADGPLASRVGTSFLRAAIDGVAVAKFNDGPDTTHADILALYDRAIALGVAA